MPAGGWLLVNGFVAAAAAFGGKAARSALPSDRERRMRPPHRVVDAATAVPDCLIKASAARYDP